jgi:nitrate/nitrite-specific signal transduction histidine kinase
MTGYQNIFRPQQELHPISRRLQQGNQKQRLMSPPDPEPTQLARNLAKMMFGSHMHKWTTSKVVEDHVQNLTRARKRLAHLKK